MTDPPHELGGKRAELLALRLDQRNAGPPPALLAEQFITPSDLFFVRSHASAPAIDPADFRLQVDGMVDRPLSLTLADLAALPRQSLVAALQCAGNRRSELLALGPIPDELAWGAGAVSNGEWAGVPLAALLELAGPQPGALHVALESCDAIVRGGATMPFGASIPLEKARAPEVLLADTLNGAPLPHIHGAPLRALVPGYIGARSVKWLSRITLQPEPSRSHFQARAYKLFPPHIGPETAVWEEGLMLGELSLTSVICAPAPGALPAGRVQVRGYALAGGGRTVERVDLSSDGGATWRQAELGRRERWAWRLWSAELELPPGRHTLAARAWDSAANVQPESLETVWNFKGYMNNAWHRVEVEARGSEG